MKRTIIAIILVASLVVAYLLFAKGDVSPEQPNVDGLTSVDIGYSRLRISLPVFVAKEKGFFEEFGIDANLEMYETAQPLMQALLEGRVDVAGYTALPITYNGMLRSGKDLYFVSIMVEDQEHRISYLLRPVTEAGESPKIKSVKDLEGKVVGILPTIAYKSWLEAILIENGLTPDQDVIIQQTAPTLQSQALRSGGVDALFTNDPSATSAIRTGVAELISDEVEVPAYLGSPFPFGSFNVSKEWADSNPETMSNIAKALEKAIDFVNANPEEAKDFMKPYLPEQFQSHVQFYPDAQYMKMGKSNEKILQDAADQYLDIGIINKPLNLSGLTYEQP